VIWKSDWLLRSQHEVTTTTTTSNTQTVCEKKKFPKILCSSTFSLLHAITLHWLWKPIASRSVPDWPTPKQQKLALTLRSSILFFLFSSWRRWIVRRCVCMRVRVRERVRMRVCERYLKRLKRCEVKIAWVFLGSISSTLYVQLLRA